MKLGWFSDNYLPMQNSGVVVSIARFGKEMTKRGHEIHLYCPTADRETHNGMIIHSCNAMPFKPYPGLRLGYPINMNPPKFDLVHAHSPFTLGWYAIKTGLKQDIPKVMTYHTVFEESVSYVVSIGKETAKKISSNYMDFHHGFYDYLVAPSECMRKATEHLQIPTRVIPTGVDFDEVNIVKNAKQALGFEDKKVYLSLSRIAEEKNIDIVIKAANKFLDKDSVLLVVGKGPPEIEEKLKACAKNKNIIFTGFVPQEMISTYYSAADFFITASKSETQGLTTLEAMAHGIPVIAANAMANPEFVENGINGYLFMPDDIKQLTDIVNKIKIPEQIMKRRARETAEKYTMKKCADMLENYYEEILSK